MHLCVVVGSRRRIEVQHHWRCSGIRWADAQFGVGIDANRAAIVVDMIGRHRRPRDNGGAIGHRDDLEVGRDYRFGTGATDAGSGEARGWQQYPGRTQAQQPAS